MRITIEIEAADLNDGLAKLQTKVAELAVAPTPVEEPKPAAKKAAPAKPKAAPKPKPEPEPEPEPEEEDVIGGDDEEEITLETAVTLASELVDKGKVATVKKALTDLGIRRVSELKGDDIAAFVAAVRA